MSVVMDLRMITLRVFVMLVELPRPSALGKRLMHFPFEMIIWDTKVF
jgi:hypothetical protein